MGLLDKFKKNSSDGRTNGGRFFVVRGQEGQQAQKTVSGRALYSNEVVQQVIRCKVNEYMKLEPRHVIRKGGSIMQDDGSSVAGVLRKPNEYQTTAEFLSAAAFLHELTKNVYILPDYVWTNGGQKKFTALHILRPQTTSILQDANGKQAYRFTFADGRTATLARGSVIHWKKDYGANEYFGGDISGSNDNRGLEKAVTEYEQLCEGIAHNLNISNQINGVLSFNGYLDDDDMKADRDRMLKDIQEGRGGILVMDDSATYTDMHRDLKVIDAETLNTFYRNIARTGGVSLAILNGDYTPQQKQAFYEHALEGDMVALSQAMTAGLFTVDQIRRGHRVELYPNKIEFMTIEQKVAYMNIAVPAGALSVNQILHFGGLPPIEGGDEIRPRGYNELDQTPTGEAPAASEGPAAGESEGGEG